MEMCDKAIKNHGGALKHTPEQFITPELCTIAVSQDGGLLKYVPEKFITQELCKIAINDELLSFEYVPEELRTFEMCDFAMKKDKYGEILEFVPDEFQEELAEKYDINLPEKGKDR